MSARDSIVFGTLHEDGTLTDERLIPRSAIVACPHLILVAGHYREDGTCRCDDPDAAEMTEGGYAWRDGRWV